MCCCAVCCRYLPYSITAQERVVLVGDVSSSSLGTQQLGTKITRICLYSPDGWCNFLAFLPIFMWLVSMMDKPHSLPWVINWRNKKKGQVRFMYCVYHREEIILWPKRKGSFYVDGVKGSWQGKSFIETLYLALNAVMVE